jgi:gamma-glutamylputrescine oxidase
VSIRPESWSSGTSSRWRDGGREPLDAGVTGTAPYWLDAPRNAFPPLAGDEQVDFAIVGGGVTGLACARTLAEAGLTVRVLEARRVGHGASGRNGGFALRGLAAGYDRVRLPDLMRLTEEALGRLAELAGASFRPVGSLRVAVGEDELAAIRAEHDALAADGFAVDWLEREELPPLLRRHMLGGVFHPPDGALDQGRWIRRLAGLAQEAGARIAEETPATCLAGTRLRTRSGDVSAEHVVIATDGYTHGLVPELDAAVVPARAQAAATAPLARRHFDCPVYARWGYDYWQQVPDGALVIGGWRDTNLAGEFTREDVPTEQIQARIDHFLLALLGERPRVTHRWAGLLGFTADLLPLVGPLPGRPGVWASLGYSGHGNVLALACGELLARAILGRPDARLAQLSPERFPAARPPA